MNFDLYGFGPALLAGTWITIQLALCSLALGLCLGLTGALAKTSPYRTLRWLGDAYSTMVRGVPELLWVLLIYYGSVGFVRELGEAIGYP
ncbi:MAG: ABC transporter permease subunit, partial [Pseudomonas sp.]